MIKLKDILAEGPADDDMKAAKKIEKDLQNAISSIDDGVNLINKKLSSFNSPGLRVAFLYAIKKHINTQTQKFDARRAKSDLQDYYNR